MNPVPSERIADERAVRAVVFLHGHDDDADTWAAAARELTPAKCIVLRPTAPLPTESRATWFRADDDGVPRADDVHTALAVIDAIVDEACRHASVDAEQVAVVGFSQGAALALLWALADRPSPSGRARGGPVVAIAGWLPEVDGIALAVAARTAPLLLAHGTDDEVVPFPLGRSVAKMLERAGVPVTFVAHDEGHDPGPFTADVRAWLERQPIG